MRSMYRDITPPMWGSRFKLLDDLSDRIGAEDISDCIAVYLYELCKEATFPGFYLTEGYVEAK